MVFSKAETVLLATLPIGRENAVTAKEIGTLMGHRLGAVLDARKVRSIASQLRRRGVLIASSPTPPYGFYRPKTLAEAEECREQLAKRLREVRRTVAAYDRALQRARIAAAVRQSELPGLERGA